MALVEVACPLCKTKNVVKFGLNRQGKQRYQCKNEACSKNTFILAYKNKGCLPEVKDKIVEMALNGSGIRDTSRVLDISITTVLSELKKEASLKNINHALLQQLDCTNLNVDLVPAEEVELDEMWSFVKNKSNQRWLWHAIDHASGKVLAYVFGARKDKIFSQLKTLLIPFGVKHFYTDDWGAYERKLPSPQHTISKTNTQQIERKHLTFRTRIK